MGSDLGPSASQAGGDQEALRQMLDKAQRQLGFLTRESPLKWAASGGSGGRGTGSDDPYADRKDNVGRCKFCMRSECLYITGGKPCREYHQAMNWLGEQRASRRKALEESKAKDKDK